MPLFSRCVFQCLQWSARRGLRDDSEAISSKHRARATGIRGETYAYWYLRQKGYVFIAKNYIPRGTKGELDLVGYDQGVLAFVEVRTRTATDAIASSPELSVTTDKQRAVARTAARFRSERHLAHLPSRFDVLAIENRSGYRPEIRLHKDAFSPQM